MLLDNRSCTMVDIPNATALCYEWNGLVITELLLSQAHFTGFDGS